MHNWLRDFVHNALVHPLLPFLPTSFGDRLHDRNAEWAFGATHHRTTLLEAHHLDAPADITAHDLFNLTTSESEGAELFRVLCTAWTGEDAERAGPQGPRIGTIYVENNEGLIEVRLVTRLRHPSAHGVAA